MARFRHLLPEWTRLAVGTACLSAIFVLTPAVPAFAGIAPTAPTNVGASTGSGKAYVVWTPPSNSGSSPIDHYVITTWNGNGSRSTSVPDVTVGGTSNSGFVYGLQNGSAYFFDVFVFNATDYNYGMSNTAVPFQAYQNTTSFQNFNFAGGLSVFPYVYPDTAVGKLYFKVNPSDPGYATCSAAVVNSPSGNLIVTAGHCVNAGGVNGTIGHWYSNFYFYPAYNGNQGSIPYGYFTANYWVTTGSWANYSNFHDDFAVLRLTPNAGGTVQSQTGALGISFNDAEPVRRSLLASGYPDNVGNGIQMAYCSGDTAILANVGNSAPDDGSQQGIGCNMTQGASGGPWRTSDGLVHSVSSYTDPGFAPSNLFGPYLGFEPHQVWHYGVALA